MSTKHLFLLLPFLFRKAGERSPMITGMGDIFYCSFCFCSVAGREVLWFWGCFLYSFGFSFVFQKSRKGSRHWTDREITLSLEQLLSLLSRHTADFKVQLVRNTRNAAGNLQVIKQLRSDTEKNGEDEWYWRYDQKFRDQSNLKCHSVNHFYACKQGIVGKNKAGEEKHVKNFFFWLSLFALSYCLIQKDSYCIF